MSDDIEQKKNLEENLYNLLKFVKELEPSQGIKIYENLIAILKTDIEKTKSETQTCKSCDTSLDPWEKEICGPCKISDKKIPEEEE